MDLIQQFSQQQNGLAILLILSTLIGAISVFALYNRKSRHLVEENNKLTMQLTLEKQASEQFDAILDQTHTQLANSFNQLSNEALSRNNEHFLKLENILFHKHCVL